MKLFSQGHSGGLWRAEEQNLSLHLVVKRSGLIPSSPVSTSEMLFSSCPLPP